MALLSIKTNNCFYISHLEGRIKSAEDSVFCYVREQSDVAIRDLGLELFHGTTERSLSSYLLLELHEVI